MRAGSSFSMIIQGTMFLFLIVGSIFYIYKFHSEDIKLLLIKFDTIGITEIGDAEQKRIDAISSLDIPYEQRKALTENTIFIGANKLMVVLALGEPIRSTTNEYSEDVWIYHFDARSRPVLLHFDDDEILYKAEKGSALDTVEIK